MTSYTAPETRRLPRGWAHLALQFAFWMGFYAVYQLVRGFADRDIATAFWNGFHVIRIEEWMGTLFEPTLQRLVDSSELLIKATTYTYWLSQFVVVGATLLWVYFKHHDRFFGFRNWLILANLAGLAFYLLVPTAPPRMFPEWGFVDTLAQYSGVNHESGLIAHTANPYAAMPSLHSMDAFIVGDRHVRRLPQSRREAFVGALAGVGVVLGHGDREPLLAGRRRRGHPGDRHRPHALPALGVRALARGLSGVSERQTGGPHVSELDRVKQEYTQAARQILQRSMKGVAKTKLTPDMLTMTGVSLCLAGALLVGFEQRNEKAFFWIGGILFVVGSVADILDGALARAASKGTVFGAFLDSTFDRLGEAAILAAIGLVVHARRQRDRAPRDLRRGDRLVPRLVYPCQGGGARPARRRRLRLARRACRADLDRARARAVGLAAMADLSARGDGVAHGGAADPVRPQAAAELAATSSPTAAPCQAPLVLARFPDC